MMRFCFDTNIFIGRRVPPFQSSPVFSSLVLCELVASANPSEVKLWDVVRRDFAAQNRLLVPSEEDWWETAKALNRLTHAARREAGGAAPKLLPAERMRLFNDVLLAVSCRRARVTLVTDNLKNFERIAAVCKTKVVSGDEFFAA